MGLDDVLVVLPLFNAAILFASLTVMCIPCRFGNWVGKNAVWIISMLAVSQSIVMVLASSRK